MTKSRAMKAVIYCRVSSQKQVQKGDGLGSQETRCRDFAKLKGYEVVDVFKDEGVYGSMIDRPAMQNMLKFLASHKKKQTHIVLIDDISRLARSLDAHIHLRTAINEAGGKLESPSIEFGEDSDSILVENLLASVSQHQRQKNAEQTKNRMHARVMNGYWPFYPPTGYKYASVKGENGRVLVRDEPLASVIAETLEGFAAGRFETHTEIKRYLQDHTIFPIPKSGEIHIQRIDNMLNQPLYAGYMTIEKWDIKLRPAKHEPLISFETYQEIQERLHGKAKAPAKANLSDDFPLRGFITCNCCGEPMTGCWSKGRNQKYPYYYCYNKDCTEFRKSVRKEKVEAEFEELLLELKPSQELFFTAMDMFRDLWAGQKDRNKGDVIILKQELSKIDDRVEQFLDRIVDTESPKVISAYEQKIEKLEQQKIVIQEKIQNCGRPLTAFDETFRTAMDFLANPHRLWTSDKLEDRRLVLRLVFSEKLPYQRNEGFRTARTALPVTVLQQLKGGDYEMARPAGFEPATPGSGNQCSIP